jgi:hypothetical protein
MYDEIKHIKWLIFPQNIRNVNIYIINYLGSKLNIDMFFKYYNYDDINSDDKIKFNKYIENIYTFLQKKPITIKIWKQILLFLTNNYTKKFIVKKELIKEGAIFNKFSLKSIEFEIKHIETILKSKIY